ncbi:EF-hand calcium-binding domain-containing protein 4B isoform X1 [Bos indicus x Bos taurus]|uniref:Calcium release activated channel regulator 2A n=2 Tax=Bos TaxID=9903 RepID=E1BER4_BOVIN|nr:EF-hand calcium-binding domain-containing protein 4B isoform X1 [Bos taurus]XP_005207280.1 EF-hand calcium-binding domain-containing protein 4B isoform X1 [Bos taurus]XP_010803927.1 EF-hand calcium-binding domain-containing protein 4B isoform X1 [Bos taurus]XP_010803928.1 EF-hand calcium-binding domain-containing protein 4B isoform X1 [Bos taurus]XP_027396852.1 EF-hand calcium-binding domain-containing protein 4B isoform X1 [Bos indicus x Bos taurus]XP_027396853.1 EF-hand calcium-binding do
MATIDGRMVSRPRGSGRGRQGSGACLGSLDDLPCEGTQELAATQLAMLRRAQEFFQTCDKEGKGFIARADMQRLHKELPLSLEDLEDVFDTLDADGNGFLTPEEFTTGFSHFFFSQNNPSQEDAGAQPAQLQEEKVYQSRGDEDLGDMDEDEEAQFQTLMDRLGAQKVLEDEADVKQLWLQLKKDEPHLLSNFEDFLTRIFSQLLEAHEEKNELECALKKKIAAYDEEIQHLYEEMEQQIKTEKEQFLLKDTERFRARSQELERKLLSKEQELEQLVQKQKRLEGQCTALHNDKHETKAENTKLRLTNQELARELERTSRELQDAQQQLESLRQEAHKLHQEKEMEVYRVTESLQREKSGLLKQLDFLRERNKHLRDEQDIRFQKDKAARANTAAPTARWKQRSGSVIGKYVDGTGMLRSQSEEEEDVFGIQRRRSSLGLSGCPLTEEEPGPGGPLTQPLRRIISIEEDPLPQLLGGGFQQPLSKCLEEKEASGQGVNEQSGPARPLGLTPTSPRGQPVGKEALSEEEGFPSTPDRLFKIVFVGNSSVGKTSFLGRFCDGRFSPGSAATVGIDYRVKTVRVDDSRVAVQLWDTAGQERYRCITQQFFRKADGVVVMYDLTARQSFLDVRQWLSSVEEAVGDRIPVLLLANKIDNEKEREVPRGLGEQLAKEHDLIFYECSAYSGHNTEEPVLHLARILKEQEDTVREDTIQVDRPAKKKACCG